MGRRRKEKLEKIHCEICKESNKATLHKHHIVERTDPNSNDHPMNLAVICSNCHNKVHDGQIKIIGLYPSNNLPYKRTLVYEENGVSNFPGITKPYYEPKVKSTRLYYETDES